jgi:hypothetical protein
MKKGGVMRRFWIAGLLVLAMMLPALPAAAKKPVKPPTHPVLFDVTMEFVEGEEGLSTNADTACGPAKSITMELDRNTLFAGDGGDALPMIDVILGGAETGFSWYRDYPYYASPSEVPTGFDPPTETDRQTGDTITGCHGAGIDVYVDYFAPGDHRYELRAGLFRLEVGNGTVDLLWHSDYYVPYERLNKKKWAATTMEDFTYSGALTWTGSWDPETGGTGIVSGDLRVSHFSPGEYDLFVGAPRPVKFMLVVTPQGS